ncbi:aldehyde dehydrogenase [Aquimarina rhabdastrellae]
MEYATIIAQQRSFFNTHATKKVSFRIQQLKKLKACIQHNETLLFDAIYKDFKKSDYETYVSELSLIYHEIDLAIAKVKKWSKRKRVLSSLANFPSKSYIIPEPLGSTLIIGAWNYPYQLSLGPVVGAMAAGCTIILKPSEIAMHSAQAMQHIINTTFDPEYCTVILGGIAETSALLEHKFDKIFFTGSTHVGKIIYQAAAKHLTPVTLELGGKSPAIVTPQCDIAMTAKRLVWAKFLNAGQTCIAPDYIMVHEDVHDALLEALITHIKKAQYTIANKNYTQIINDRNFDRLIQYIDASKVAFGGSYDQKERTITPTLLTAITFDDTVMQEEIFGPILPILKYTSIDTAIQQIRTLDKPLSCYVFTKNTALKNKILNEISFGGGAINDAVMHITESRLPFGGVGNSGMGNYHGEAGFESFSHYKGILQKPFWLEPNLKYAPYNSTKLNIIKKLLG